MCVCACVCACVWGPGSITDHYEPSIGYKWLTMFETGEPFCEDLVTRDCIYNEYCSTLGCMHLRANVSVVLLCEHSHILRF